MENGIQHPYEYLVMSFGLTNAPAVFQASVNDVLRDMINQYVFVYLDDILVFSKDFSSHHKHVRSVLVRLLQNNLFFKTEKCEFHQTATSFPASISHLIRLQYYGP